MRDFADLHTGVFNEAVVEKKWRNGRNSAFRLHSAGPFSSYPKFGRVPKASFVHRRIGRLHRAGLGSDSFGVVEFLKLSREAVGHHGI